MRRWEFRFSGLILILLISVSFLIIPALAHVPIFGDGGKSPEEAIPIKDPAKSRVLYGKLAAGDLKYYSFDMKQGEKIVLGIIVPVKQGRKGFAPDLILMGPGLMNEGKVPEALEVPEGYGVEIFSGVPESPVYEGFTPSAFYSLASPELNAPKSGTYYAVASSKQVEGNYGIVLGYKETFTLMEWITIPINQIRVYLWEGQSLLLIFFLPGITLALGLLVIFFKREVISGFNPSRISGIFAGLFFLGTGLSFIFQMLISLSKSSYSSEVSVTLFLVLASLVLGVTALILSLKDEDYGARSTRKRLYFFIIGIAGLLFWAGWLIGPLLAFEAAVLPWRRKG
jgi:hypothetical protein